jgi:hypothetical protein
MMESVNQKSRHTASRPGEHPSSKDVTWLDIWDRYHAQRHQCQERPEHNARPLYPGQSEDKLWSWLYLAVTVQVGSFRLR